MLISNNQLFKYKEMFNMHMLFQTIMIDTSWTCHWKVSNHSVIQIADIF